MSESKEYVSQNVENGSIHISEEVVSAIVSMAIKDVEGVYGLHANVGKKNSTKSVRLVYRSFVRFFCGRGGEERAGSCCIHRGIHDRLQGEQRQCQHQRNFHAPRCQKMRKNKLFVKTKGLFFLPYSL